MFHGYAPALASFAQSYASLPKSHFDSYDLAMQNAKQINEELRAIYRRARELKAKTGKQDQDVWKVYHEIEAAPSAAATTTTTATTTSSPFSFAPTLAAAATASTSAINKPAEAPKFGFGRAFTAGATNSLSLPTSNGPAAAAAAPVFSFGFKAAPAPTPAPAAGGPSFPAFGAAPASAAAAEKRPVKYCEPEHFTGPYFDMPRFWETEVVARAPLLNLNNGFLEANREALQPRLAKWAQKASFYKKPVKYVAIEDEDEEVVRVIIKDADRTFFEPEHRQKMVALLNAMYTEFGAYGQAMSYLAGLCMLVLNEEDTAAVLRFVATEHIRGHWAAEAVGFATSAWVVEYFMKKTQPDVAKHLQSLNFWPDTYLQKILTGLCIHVLPFADLFDFLDAFMDGSMRYLIRFCLAIVEHFRADILAIKSSTEANKLYEIMRLDTHVVDHADVRAILDRAPCIDLGEDGASLDLIRSQVYGEKVEPRLKRAPKTATFEPCVQCEKGVPKWYCDDLGPVCDSCKAAHPEFVYEKY